MRSGLFDIAAARYSRPSCPVSRTQYDLNMRAQTRVATREEPAPETRRDETPRRVFTIVRAGPTAPTRRRRRRRRKQTPRRSAKANERVARRRAGRRNATKRNRESRNGANGDRLGARLGVVGDDEDARAAAGALVWGVSAAAFGARRVELQVVRRARGANGDGVIADTRLNVTRSARTRRGRGCGS